MGACEGDLAHRASGGPQQGRRAPDVLHRLGHWRDARLCREHVAEKGRRGDLRDLHDRRGRLRVRGATVVGQGREDLRPARAVAQLLARHGHLCQLPRPEDWRGLPLRKEELRDELPGPLLLRAPRGPLRPGALLPWPSGASEDCGRDGGDVVAYRGYARRAEGHGCLLVLRPLPVVRRHAAFGGQCLALRREDGWRLHDPAADRAARSVGDVPAEDLGRCGVLTIVGQRAAASSDRDDHHSVFARRLHLRHRVVRLHLPPPCPRRQAPLRRSRRSDAVPVLLYQAPQGRYRAGEAGKAARQGQAREGAPEGDEEAGDRHRHVRGQDCKEEGQEGG
mmetsp:Transcript_111741/g.322961  ORF Transcript_111741/g.322961 Transcript_111741/m.322961 type:complete len:336 (+) Transcript_111741:1224-2231(+)